MAFAPFNPKSLSIFASMRKIPYLLIVTILTICLPACRNIKEVTYFQQTDTTKADSKVVYPNFNKDRTKNHMQPYEGKIQSNDILSIFVWSLSPEASSFFNTSSPSERSGQGDVYTTRNNVGYLVDTDGNIELPLIGKVMVAGLTTVAAKDTLTRRLEKYLQSPSVRIYFENFRVTILGEVYRPGVYTVTNEKISIPEALGLAGDLNIYGDRKEILLIREEDGVKSYIKVDLTKRDLFNSSYYYLRSNDVLYISPVKGRVAQSDNFYRVAPLVLSSLTLIAVLLTRLIK
ncbi:polysaccharide biosynthesis/export family protein [soil metagenome]